MLLIFLFVTFLFYKIMPPLLFGIDNTVLGSAIMAISSTAAVAGAQFSCSYLLGRWMIAKGNDNSKAPFPYILAILAYMAASTLATVAAYLVSIGFAAKMHRSLFSHYGYRDDVLFWFWVFIEIPIACDAVIMLLRLRNIDLLTK